MLARIRKVKNNNIIILNDISFKNNIVNNYVNMLDVKEDLKKLSIFPMQIEYVTKLDICYKICKYDDYTNNYLHNLLEIEDKKPFYFLCHLKELIISKGHEYNYIEKNNTEIKHEKGNNELYNNIMCSHDISCEEYEKIEHKKKCNDNLTKCEKIQSIKYYYKYKLSLNNLNIDIIKMYYNKFYLLNNFLCIIDINNYKLNENCENIKNYNKLILIKKFIIDIGIMNIFDENWNISEDNLIKILILRIIIIYYLKKKVKYYIIFQIL